MVVLIGGYKLIIDGVQYSFKFRDGKPAGNNLIAGGAPPPAAGVIFAARPCEITIGFGELIN